VHSGTADSGHYYSFCADRLAKGRGAELWCEFNDKVVHPRRAPPPRRPSVTGGVGGEVGTWGYLNVGLKKTRFAAQNHHWPEKTGYLPPLPL